MECSLYVVSHRHCHLGLFSILHAVLLLKDFFSIDLLLYIINRFLGRTSLSNVLWPIDLCNFRQLSLINQG